MSESEVFHDAASSFEEIHITIEHTPPHAPSAAVPPSAAVSPLHADVADIPPHVIQALGQLGDALPSFRLDVRDSGLPSLQIDGGGILQGVAGVCNYLCSLMHRVETMLHPHDRPLFHLGSTSFIFIFVVVVIGGFMFGFGPLVMRHRIVVVSVALGVCWFIHALVAWTLSLIPSYMGWFRVVWIIAFVLLLGASVLTVISFIYGYVASTSSHHV